MPKKPLAAQRKRVPSHEAQQKFVGSLPQGSFLFVHGPVARL
jgi:hypothetical protein